MFDKLRKTARDLNEKLLAAAKLPPDLMAVPDVRGQSLGTIDRAAFSAYVGRPVESIEAMGSLGPQATSSIGERLQSQMRAAGGGGVDELLPGLNAKREQQMRAWGATDEQLAAVGEHVGARMAAHVAAGWDIVFDDDHRASVQLFPRASEEWQQFDAMAAKWARENGTDGHPPSEPAALSARYHRITKSPYESYEYKGTLVARNATHAAVARSSRLDDWTLAAIAAVALRTAE